MTYLYIIGLMLMSLLVCIFFTDFSEQCAVLHTVLSVEWFIIILCLHECTCGIPQLQALSTIVNAWYTFSQFHGITVYCEDNII